MHQRGQIIDTSRSEGLTIGEYWAMLFELNESNFEQGSGVMDDEDISVKMFSAFPFHRSSSIFRDVVKVRNRYNRGVQHNQKGVRPSRPSFRYIHRGEAGVQRCTARGRPIAGAPAEGT